MFLKLELVPLLFFFFPDFSFCIGFKCSDFIVSVPHFLRAETLTQLFIFSFWNSLYVFDNFASVCIIRRLDQLKCNQWFLPSLALFQSTGLRDMHEIIAIGFFGF